MPINIRNWHMLIALVIWAVASVLVPATTPTVSLSTSSSNQQETAEASAKPKSSFIGSSRCVSCHRPQSSAWSETQHALAFEHLPEKYRNDESCLKCHVTGLGEPGGYTLDMPEDQATSYRSVGCETCHGPGAAHEDAVKRWTLSDPADEEKLLKEIKTTIVRMPTDTTCATCHVNQSHQAHPPFDGQTTSSRPAFHSTGKTTAASVVPPPSPHSYSVKTCGSCHYVQYKHWNVGKHVDLSATLPDKYGDNQDCLKCHRQSLKPWDWYTAAEDSQSDRVGVGCESCHGSALKHVQFNKQFISGRKLEPELVEASRQTIREGQSNSKCLECHVREGHVAHPKYDGADSPASK